MRPDDLDVARVQRLMRCAVLGQRRKVSRFDDPEASFHRGRTEPVAEEDLAAAKENARRAQDQFLRDLENRIAAVLAEVQKQRVAWNDLEASGDCLDSELLTAVQEEDPGPKSGWSLYEDKEERTFSG